MKQHMDNTSLFKFTMYFAQSPKLSTVWHYHNETLWRGVQFPAALFLPLPLLSLYFFTFFYFPSFLNKDHENDNAF